MKRSRLSVTLGAAFTACLSVRVRGRGEGGNVGADNADELASQREAELRMTREPEPERLSKTYVRMRHGSVTVGDLLYAKGGSFGAANSDGFPTRSHS